MTKCTDLADSDLEPAMHRNTTIRLSSRRRPSTLDATAIFYAQIQDVRQQLSDQFKCLDMKLEIQTAIMMELQEFFRRKAEVELEYSKNLDKLVKQFQLRHKTEKQKREPWGVFSTFGCWQQLMNITKKESRDHSVISEVYGITMATKLGEISDDLKRLFIKCRDVGFACHDDMFKQLNELQTAMKQYHVYHSESKLTEAKVKHIEDQRVKVEQQATKASKKVKLLETQADKESSVYQENKLKTLNARNDYLLAIEAANSSLLKYHDDLNMLIDSADFGYHNSMQRTMLTYASSLECLRTSQQQACDGINKCIQGLDRTPDKEAFRNLYSAAFVKPKRFDFQPHKGDEVCQVSAQKLVQDDLVQRYQQLCKRVETQRVENDEMWKSVEEVDRNLVAVIHAKDVDIVEWFQSENTPKSPTTNENRKRRMEMEQYYFQKLQDLLMSNNLLARLQARYSLLKKALGEAGELPRISGGTVRMASGSRPPSLPPKPIKARVVGKMPLVGQPKVFGCNLEEYIQATGEDIPMVVRSCIRTINLYGMHHEGIFRVSGLQAEINEMKANFEKGLDSLAILNDCNSVNSVASVLKSFFRELREPMFPHHLFDSLVDAIRVTNVQDMTVRLSELIYTLPPPRIIVARYLFAFLNHLSEYSDENLMYAYNLSVCFGPTLLPIPPEKDQVAYQSNVNDVIKFIIMHHDKIFRNDGGPVYEKVLTDAGVHDEGDGSDNDQNEGEDTMDVIEAVAVYDFDGRSTRELSFKKGDLLILYSRVNTEWWEGACKGTEGLVPDKYIKRVEDHSGSHASSSSIPDCDDKRVPSAATSSPNLDQLGNSRRMGMSGSVSSVYSHSATTPTSSKEMAVSIKSSSQLGLQAAPPIERPSSPCPPAARSLPESESPAAESADTQLRLSGGGSAVTLISETDADQLGADVDSIMAEVVSDLEALAGYGSAASQQATRSASMEVAAPQVAVPPAAATALPSGGGDSQKPLSASVAGSLPPEDQQSPVKRSTSAVGNKANSLPRSVFASPGLGTPKAAAAFPTPYMTDEPGKQLMSFRRAATAKDAQPPGGAGDPPGGSKEVQLASRDNSAKAFTVTRSLPPSDIVVPVPSAASAVKLRVVAESGTADMSSKVGLPQQQQPLASLVAVSAASMTAVLAGSSQTSDGTSIEQTASVDSTVSTSSDAAVGRKMPPPIPAKSKPTAASVAAALKQQQTNSAKKADNSTQL